MCTFRRSSREVEIAERVTDGGASGCDGEDAREDESFLLVDPAGIRV